MGGGIQAAMRGIHVFLIAFIFFPFFSISHEWATLDGTSRGFRRVMLDKAPRPGDVSFNDLFLQCRDSNMAGLFCLTVVGWIGGFFCSYCSLPLSP
jgi:hypothetical protein